MKALLTAAFAILILLAPVLPGAKNKTLKSNAKPGNRVYHCMLYDDDLHSNILLDGYHQDNTPEFGEVWSWNGKDWKVLPGKGPLVGGAGGAAFDSRRNEIILFGGLHYRGPEEGKLLGDSWKWNGKEWKQIIAPGPELRGWHSMMYDGYRDNVVLFGGSTGFGKTAFGDTWEWDGNKCTKINVKGPEPRADFAMVYDSMRRKLCYSEARK